MFLIDQYAYSNKLKNVHPGEKVLFALLTMGTAIATKAIAVHAVVMVLMVVVTLLIAGIPQKAYLNLLLLPLSFIFLGVLPVLVVISYNDIGYIYAIRILNLYLGITKEGFDTSTIIFFRSIATAMCLYFISLTTPLIDIIEMLKKIKLSNTLIEIMSLIYRFIFVLIEASVIIYNAQSARLGYSSIKTSFRSLGKLVSMVFIKAYNHSQALYVSLMSRGYDQELNVISKAYKLNKRNIIIITMTEIILIILSIVIGGS